MKDIQALKKEYEDKEWEKFKEKFLFKKIKIFLLMIIVCLMMKNLMI